MIDYSKNNIKKYRHWTVRVHPNQQYLGRCVIWCDRENAYDLVDATTEELLEFTEIIKEFKQTLEKTFNADWMNYSFLGNSDAHLHCHLVPRYKSEREFNGQIFTDPRWGHNWLLDKSFTISDEMLDAIKEKIKGNL